MRLIDADALMDDGIKVEFGYDNDGIIMIPMRDVNNSIRNAPTVDAEPVRHGRWIPVWKNIFKNECYKCSVCGCKEMSYGYAYCHCGAKMDGGDESV